MAGALDGIRVLDLSRYIAGPFCGMMLADMGAEVIKVEKKGKGDDSRGLSPFKNDQSLYYTSYNRNKKSITLDFRSFKGQEILKELVKKSDVLIENFRPGSLAKMGLSKEVLRDLNSRLIVTSVSGFGQDGPYQNRAAFDCIAQAMSGLMSLTGDAKSSPMLTGTYIGDFVGALYAAFGTVTALYNRGKNGTGQFIDISLLDGMVSILATAIPLYKATGKVQQPGGNRDKVTSPANVFKTLDGYIYMHAGTDPLFKRLAALMGRPDLLEDPRFATSNARMRNVEAIETIVRQWFDDKTSAQAESLIVETGIPVSIVSTIEDLVNNPQLKAREQIVEIEYPGMGKVAMGGVTVKLSDTPGTIYRRPPTLGEHNQEVYTELLGITAQEVEALAQDGVI